MRPGGQHRHLQPASRQPGRDWRSFHWQTTAPARSTSVAARRRFLGSRSVSTVRARSVRRAASRVATSLMSAWCRMRAAGSALSRDRRHFDGQYLHRRCGAQRPPGGERHRAGGRFHFDRRGGIRTATGCDAIRRDDHRERCAHVFPSRHGGVVQPHRRHVRHHPAPARRRLDHAAFAIHYAVNADGGAVGNDVALVRVVPEPA